MRTMVWLILASLLAAPAGACCPLPASAGPLPGGPAHAPHVARAGSHGQHAHAASLAAADGAAAAHAAHAAAGGHDARGHHAGQPGPDCSPECEGCAAAALAQHAGPAGGDPVRSSGDPDDGSPGITAGHFPVLPVAPGRRAWYLRPPPLAPPPPLTRIDLGKYLRL